MPDKRFNGLDMGQIPIVGQRKDEYPMTPTEVRMFSILHEFAARHRRIAILCTLCMKEIAGANASENDPRVTLRCECRAWTCDRTGR